MTISTKVAIIAALEREIHGLVKGWRKVEREHEGRRFRFFENDEAVAVCGGIGGEAARRATEAVIALYQPEIVQSVGFAGALDPSLKVGTIFCPSCVIDSRDGSRAETGMGSGVLVSAAAIVGIEDKAKLSAVYGAHAVDMESAAVARGARARGVRFMAVKAISDESDFAMPALDRFVDRDGNWCSTVFAASLAGRPWLWPKVYRLARSTAKASKALCAELDRHAHASDEGKVPRPELRAI